MVFYFGTSSSNLEKIKVKGLENPCITDNYDVASYYGEQEIEKKGGVLTIFQINLPEGDKNYNYKENKKFKYKGVIKPCYIKMIVGPEFKKEVYAEEIFSFIKKHHTNTDEIFSSKFDRVLDFDSFILQEISLDQVQSSKKVDKFLIEEYLFLNLDECPPIVVVPNQDKYEVLDGLHRVETFKKAKKSKILAYIPVID